MPAGPPPPTPAVGTITTLVGELAKAGVAVTPRLAQAVEYPVQAIEDLLLFVAGDTDAVSVLIAVLVDDQPVFGVIGKPFGYHHPNDNDNNNCNDNSNNNDHHHHLDVRTTTHPVTSILDRDTVIVYGGSLIRGVYLAGGRAIVAAAASRDDNDPAALPRAVISSSRSRGVVRDFCALLADQQWIHPEPLLISGAGEKSLRLILQVHQEALWFFPKKGTSLWDVAAPDAILRCLGGRLTDKWGRPMDYSKSRDNAENLDGVVACIDANLHAKCIELYREGDWANREYHE